MDGGIGHQHALVLRLVAAPQVILADVVAQILPQHGAVERADGPDIQAGGLLQQGLNLGAVLAHDVEVVAAGLAQPGLVGAEGPELAEAVGGEEDLLVRLIADHHLGPVDHGGHDEGEGVAAQGEDVPLLHSEGAGGPLAGKEPGQHGEGLGVAHQGHLRVLLRQQADAAGVVGLQMLDDQVVGRPAPQLRLQLLQPLLRRPAVHGVHDGHLLVEDDVGVVGDAVGNRVLALKQVNSGIVRADIADGVGDVQVCHRRQILSSVRRRSGVLDGLGAACRPGLKILENSPGIG